MTAITQLENQEQTLILINKALAEMPILAICSLRNQLRKCEVAFVISKKELVVHAFSDIEAWGERVKLDYVEREDVKAAPWHYELNGCPSDVRYDSERDALIGAFDDIIVQQADLSDYDLFTCQRCNEYFDIEESVVVDGDELVCKPCVDKQDDKAPSNNQQTNKDINYTKLKEFTSKHNLHVEIDDEQSVTFYDYLIICEGSNFAFQFMYQKEKSTLSCVVLIESEGSAKLNWDDKLENTAKEFFDSLVTSMELTNLAKLPTISFEG